MHHHPLRTGIATLAVAGVLPLGLVACGDTANTPEAGSSTSAPLPTAASTTAAEPPIPTASNSIPAGGTTRPSDNAAVSAPFGPECSRLPGGGNDPTALAQERVATAAADVPFLSRTAGLIGTARLTDTLDQASDITVFAPDDQAFSDVSSTRLRGLLAKPSTVADVLRYHVVQGRLAPDQLAGSHQTLTGKTLEVTGSGEDFTVGGDAQVVCGNIRTANATVYVVDAVLTPPS